MFYTLIIFFVMSFINVVLNTTKSIFTVKSTKFNAALINAITFGFYNIIVKQLSELELIYSIPLTIMTNLFGVYVALSIIEYFRKDQLWEIKVTAKKDMGQMIIYRLNENDIDFTVQHILGKREEKYSINIFSANKEQSKIINKILNNYPVKYSVTVLKSKL